MPYQLTYTTTFKEPGGPTFIEFLETLDASALASFPEAAGKTPLEFVNQIIADREAHADFINRTNTSNANTETTVYTFSNLSEVADLNLFVGVTETKAPPFNWPDDDALSYLRLQYSQQHLSLATFLLEEV